MYLNFEQNQNLHCLGLKPAVAARRVGGVGAAAGVGTETGRDATALVHVPDLDLLTGRGGSAGVAGIPAAGPGVQVEGRERKAQTVGGTNMWTDRLQRNLLWVTSTTAKSPASCSLVALCSLKG